LRNARGHLVPLDTIRAQDLLQDEMVRRIVEYGKDLNAEIARYKVHTLADLGAFDALLAQEYGVSKPEAARGNRTLTSYDGNLKVSVRINDVDTWGVELQQAKALLTEMIQERAGQADPFLVALVNNAFGVEKEGKVDSAAITALRRLEFDDPKWGRVCAAIDAAKKTTSTKQYVLIYERKTPEGGHEFIPLDLSAINPSPEAFERRSLRRSVEEARKLLSVATSYLLDGAPVTALERLDSALRALGAEGIDQADMKMWRDRFAPPSAA